MDANISIDVFEDVELTNNPIYSVKKHEQKLESQLKNIEEHNNTLRDNINIKHILLYVNGIFSHIFVFSIFESLFFWFYIVRQENNALERQFENIIMISNIMCLNIDIDLEPYYEYLQNERSNYNNDVVITNTIILNIFLFTMLLFINFLMKFMKLNLYEENKKIMKKNALLFFILFCYEYAFFQTIVYNYKPKSLIQITKKLFNECR